MSDLAYFFEWKESLLVTSEENQRGSWYLDPETRAWIAIDPTEPLPAGAWLRTFVEINPESPPQRMLLRVVPLSDVIDRLRTVDKFRLRGGMRFLRWMTKVLGAMDITLVGVIPREQDEDDTEVSRVGP
jgi:hypothetical protein